MARRALTLALAVLALPAAVAVAGEQPEPMRPCRRADVLGLWEVVRFGFAAGARVDRDAPAYRLHQRFVFRADDTMTYRASATPPSIDDERALLTAAADATWTLEPAGRLLRHPGGQTRAERSDCRVVTHPLRDPRSPVPALPGDLLLTDRTEDDRPLARRLLRRLRAR